MYTQTHVRTYTQTHTHTCTYTQTHVQIHTCTYTQTHVHAYIDTHTTTLHKKLQYFVVHSQRRVLHSRWRPESTAHTPSFAFTVLSY
ncbi:unnamed protein product [Staurois parvus]|uniref:Uncharacterized protein n=1 Tax=Staurois parvus TaxID=386267 RepID=A0ABN9GQC7_9NEOB|nr:unnamed protein product [Staurois parvus]